MQSQRKAGKKFRKIARPVRNTVCRIPEMTFQAVSLDRWPLLPIKNESILRGPQPQNCILMRILSLVLIWLRGVGDNFIHSTNIFAAYHVQKFSK